MLGTLTTVKLFNILCKGNQQHKPEQRICMMMMLMLMMWLLLALPLIGIWLILHNKVNRTLEPNNVSNVNALRWPQCERERESVTRAYRKHKNAFKRMTATVWCCYWWWWLWWWCCCRFAHTLKIWIHFLFINNKITSTKFCQPVSQSSGIQQSHNHNDSEDTQNDRLFFLLDTNKCSNEVIIDE